MTPDQQKQIQAVQARIRCLRLGGASPNMLAPTLRREGWPEAAIREALSTETSNRKEA